MLFAPKRSACRRGPRVLDTNVGPRRARTHPRRRRGRRVRSPCRACVPVWRVYVDEDVVGDGAVVGEGEVYAGTTSWRQRASLRGWIVGLPPEARREARNHHKAGTEANGSHDRADGCAVFSAAYWPQGQRKVPPRLASVPAICDQVLVITAGMDAKPAFASARVTRPPPQKSSQISLASGKTAESSPQSSTRFTALVLHTSSSSAFHSRTQRAKKSILNFFCAQNALEARERWVATRLPPGPIAPPGAIQAPCIRCPGGLESTGRKPLAIWAKPSREAGSRFRSIGGPA